MLLGRYYHYATQAKDTRPTDDEVDTRDSMKCQFPASPPRSKSFGLRPATNIKHSLARQRPNQTSDKSSGAGGGPRGDVNAARITAVTQDLILNQSEPLNIPRRPRISPPAQTPSEQSRRKVIRDNSKNDNLQNDNPKSNHTRQLLPHVATLLASTTIPRKRSYARPRLVKSQRISSEELVEHWKQLELEEDNKADPNLEILLSPPQSRELLSQAISYESLGRSSITPSGSSSSDSLPSLDGDENSPLSWSSPRTPPSTKRGPSSVASAKERSLSSPASIDCLSDHPLLRTAEDLHEEVEQIELGSPSLRIARKANVRTSLRKDAMNSSATSTLSMSLKALRLAARSFSNFAAPSLLVLPEDHLSLSLIHI